MKFCLGPESLFNMCCHCYTDAAWEWVPLRKIRCPETWRGLTGKKRHRNICTWCDEKSPPVQTTHGQYLGSWVHFSVHWIMTHKQPFFYKDITFPKSPHDLPFPPQTIQLGDSALTLAHFQRVPTFSAVQFVNVKI